MSQIGPPLVQPLSVALPQLDPVAQTQLARVLAEIGYPQALPALKQSDRKSADRRRRPPQPRRRPSMHHRCKTPQATADASAADLYLALGYGSYRTATRNPANLDSYDTRHRHRRRLAVQPQAHRQRRPGPRLSHRARPHRRRRRRHAGRREPPSRSTPTSIAALSLFVIANLRRENRLPDGANDPSYPSSRQSPRYYAMVAGPQRLQDVLEQALNDNDAELALDAIAALSATASLDALQPLVRGLGYPDRRVRFRSAQALAKAMPSESFTNDFRVVPVLANRWPRG